MHIAWLGKKTPFCGNVTYGREVTNALLDRGHQVSFIHFAQEEDTLAENRAECQEVPIPFLYKSQIYTIPSFKSSKVLTKALQELKPDLVHASLTLSPLDFLLPEICEELGLPLVATFHPPFDRKRRNLTSGTQHLMYQLYAPFLANYSQVIVFSKIQRDLLIRLGVPQSRVAIIPNGVDAEKYSPGFSKLKSQINAQRVFVYQGRIAIEKNVESLLRAWKQAEMGKDSKLVIVGNGAIAPALMNTYGADLGIVWMGFVADEQQRIQILRGADVFILPSLVEGLSLSLLEAMSCGVACLATDAGADGEVLEEGAGIVLSTQRVSTQLQTLLPMFQDHPELTTLLGRKARQRVLDRYTLTQNITQLEDLYRQVLKQQHVYSSTSV
ncbi:MAG: glycosyltransferase family 4 protein [Oculatellaceae cyanobacterium Prado106]|jgi:glycosyltransferase involved in cell wall biosynthesis|nr:glycosyltransferase family 4 protein [Oculatellaceae cyanobacterium Prado106]